MPDTTDKLTLEDETAWNELPFKQLADARASAKDWRNGLLGLLGLTSIFSAVRGQTEVQGLEPWAAAAVGLCLFLSIASAVIGTTVAMRAAFGYPRVLTRNAFRDLGGQAGYQLVRARRVEKDLNHARTATVLALLFATAAIGLSWYAPRHDEPPLVLVTRHSGERICGVLGTSNDGLIQVGTVGSGAMIIDLSDILSIVHPKECP